MTLEEAKALRRGDILYHVTQRNADGTPQRWRVSGAVKTWKTQPLAVRVPLKHALRTCDYLDERNLHLLVLDEEVATMSASATLGT